jgi:hypothetical protein
VTLDGAAHILGDESAQTFQIDFRSEWNHCRIYGYGMVCLGMSATEGDPVALAAAERTGAIGRDFNSERGARVTIRCIFQPGAYRLLFCFR